MDNDVIQLERQSLEALRHNYPQLQQLSGSIMFLAEADSHMVTATSWHFTDADNLILKQTGVKGAILELLVTLLEQVQTLPRPNRGLRHPRPSVSSAYKVQTLPRSNRG